MPRDARASRTRTWAICRSRLVATASTTRRVNTGSLNVFHHWAMSATFVMVAEGCDVVGVATPAQPTGMSSRGAWKSGPLLQPPRSIPDRPRAIRGIAASVASRRCEANRFCRVSFITKRLNWIEFRGLRCRVVSENNSHGGGDRDRRNDRWKRRRGGPMEEQRDKIGTASSNGDADDAANEAEHNGFEKKLPQHVTRLRAHRHAQSDLACAFRHGHEHDVHDAD